MHHGTDESVRELAANSLASTRRRPSPLRIRPGVQRILDAITGAPAWVRNDRMDFLAANRLGYALSTHP
jgi:transcription regulator MmyB-like protein